MLPLQTQKFAMTQVWKYSYKNIWRVAFPILISLVVEHMIGLTDTAFLGRVGEIELGASAIASIYYMVIFMLGFGFSIGSQIIIGRRNGEGNYKQTGYVFWQGLYFLLGLAVVLILLSEAVTPWLLSKMVSSPNVYHAALDYVTWRLPGMLFAYCTTIFRAFYVGTTSTKTLTFNAIVMALSNIVFNYILIFGKLGVPALGIKGAAIGSSLAELVSLIFFVGYMLRSTDLKKYGLDVLPRFEWRSLREILSVSVWTMVQSFLSISTWLIFFLYIEHLGERSLAISNIVRSVSGILWMIVQAFASTTNTLVSNMIGEGKQEFVVPLIKRITKFTCYILFPLLVAFAIVPEWVIRIYTDIPDLVKATVPAMLVMVSSYLFTAPAQIFFNALSGTGNTRKAFILEMISLAIYVIYCTIVVSWLKADIAICWTAEHVYSFFVLLLSGLYMFKGKWRNTVV